MNQNTSQLPSVIIVGGMMGSGKTLFIKLLSEKIGYKTADGGAIRREMAREHNMTIEEFSEYGKEHPEFDKETDERLLKLAHEGNIVIQSRVLAYLPETKKLPSVVTIYLDCDKNERARRLTLKGEGQTVEEALHNIDVRDGNDHIRYQSLYGIDTKDHSVYDLVVNNSELTPKDTVNLVLSKLKEVSPQ